MLSTPVSPSLSGSVRIFSSKHRLRRDIIKPFLFLEKNARNN
jgi:hypothetical protein